MSDLFICSACREEFYKGRPDEEAEQERAELFPEYPLSECETICEVCYREFMEWYKKTKVNGNE